MEHCVRLEKLQTIITEIEEQDMVTSRYGTHLSSCSWSKDDATSGPESCRCLFLSRYKTEALDIMLRYYKIADGIVNNTK